MTKTPVKSVAVLLARIHKEFPELTWDSFTYTDEGWDHEVVILDKKLVFRFPNDEEYREKLENEIGILKDLQPVLPVVIPQYSYIAQDKSFAGYEIVPGQSMKKELFATLSNKEQSTLAHQMAAFLSALHGLAAAGHDVSKVPTAHMPRDQAELKRLARAHFHSVLNESDLRAAEYVIREVDALLEQKVSTVLIHSDIYSKHILWDSLDQKLGIIDFSDMNQGDPAIDFAELYDYGEAFVQLVYDQYQGPKDDTFLDRAKVYRRWIAVYVMADHFINHKTSFDEAREYFDEIKPRLTD